MTPYCQSRALPLPPPVGTGAWGGVHAIWPRVQRRLCCHAVCIFRLPAAPSPSAMRIRFHVHAPQARCDAVHFLPLGGGRPLDRLLQANRPMMELPAALRSHVVDAGGGHLNLHWACLLLHTSQAGSTKALPAQSTPSPVQPGHARGVGCTIKVSRPRHFVGPHE